MRILRFNGSATAPALVAGSAPTPQPGPGELLIRVHAAGVTPTELGWYPTTHTLEGGPRNGAIPGHEFSGKIEAVGEGQDPAQIGREVFGMNDWFAEGATAEYVVTKPAMVAPKPARLTHAEAAAVPISALTAWQGLYDRARTQVGERVLIHGGAGAVGLFAIQLARRAGTRVLATASSRHLQFLRQLGAEEVIDYRSCFFEDRAGQVNIVFDTVGGSTLQRSWKVLGPGGRIVTIAPASKEAAEERVRSAFFIVEPKGAELAEIGGLLESGELQTFLDGTVPLERASAAYQGIAPRQYGRGKLVVSVIPDPPRSAEPVAPAPPPVPGSRNSP